MLPTPKTLSRPLPVVIDPSSPGLMACRGCYHRRRGRVRGAGPAQTPALEAVAKGIVVRQRKRTKDPAWLQNHGLPAGDREIKSSFE